MSLQCSRAFDSGLQPISQSAVYTKWLDSNQMNPLIRGVIILHDEVTRQLNSHRLYLTSKVLLL